MTFSLGGAINDATNWVCDSSIADLIAKNTIFAALLLTVIVMTIVMGGYYKKSVKKTSWQKRVRIFIYALLAMMGTLYIHHYSLERELRRNIKTQDVHEVFSGLGTGGGRMSALSNPSPGGNQGGLQGGHQGGLQGGLPGGIPGGHQGGIPGGHQGGLQGVYQGGIQGGYQGVHQGGIPDGIPPGHQGAPLEEGAGLPPLTSSLWTGPAK